MTKLTDEQMQEAVRERVAELIKVAQGRLEEAPKGGVRRLVLTTPKVVFDVRGHTAGLAWARLIRLNPILLRENFDHFLKQVVGHEVAHSVVRQLYDFQRYVRPHGKEWKMVMHWFGLPPDRCHDYDVSNSSCRKMRRFKYKCGCQTVEFTAVRHNKVRRGQAEYRCPECKTKFVRV